ncbi:histidine kinase [Aureimonas sp. Leaf454]|nr:histidine kinase [Aureimonas sp. Leaf454]
MRRSVLVVEAADGPKAMAIIRSNVKIDRLVTDVGLPNGMNGRQVADAARELRQGLKVLFVTGYAESAILSQGHLGPDMEVVTKPFQMEAVTERIRSLIEG